MSKMNARFINFKQRCRGAIHPRYSRHGLLSFVFCGLSRSYATMSPNEFNCSGWIDHIRILSIGLENCSLQWWLLRGNFSFKCKYFLNSFPTFPTARKPREISHRQIFFFKKVFKVRGKAIHHFKAKKISFPKAYNVFTDNWNIL